MQARQVRSAAEETGTEAGSGEAGSVCCGRTPNGGEWAEMMDFSTSHNDGTISSRAALSLIWSWVRTGNSAGNCWTYTCTVRVRLVIQNRGPE